MIILASAIILSLNNSGMIGKANEAKAKSDAATLKESASLFLAEYDLEKQVNGKVEVEDEDGNKEEVTAKEYIDMKLTEAGFSESDKDLVVVTDAGKLYVYTRPTIPAGFVASPYEGENKVSEGFVIYQATAEEMAMREQGVAAAISNQYVWIPVPDISEFGLVNWQKETNFETTYADPVDTAEYKAMKKSVEKYGGFYIARYEAGATDDTTSLLPSVKGLEAYDGTWVTWEEAVTAVQYGNSDTLPVVATLIYGAQWDATMRFMQDVPNPVVGNGAKYIYNAVGMGWFKDTNEYEKTGADKSVEVEGTMLTATNKVKNIYDMAGHLEEWTMETKGTGYRVTRGSALYEWESAEGTGASAYPTYRNSRGETENYYALGMRVALYIK